MKYLEFPYQLVGSGNYTTLKLHYKSVVAFEEFNGYYSVYFEGMNDSIKVPKEIYEQLLREYNV